MRVSRADGRAGGRAASGRRRGNRPPARALPHGLPRRSMDYLTTFTGKSGRLLRGTASRLWGFGGGGEARQVRFEDYLREPAQGDPGCGAPPHRPPAPSSPEGPGEPSLPSPPARPTGLRAGGGGGPGAGWGRGGRCAWAGGGGGRGGGRAGRGRLGLWARKRCCWRRRSPSCSALPAFGPEIELSCPASLSGVRALRLPSPWEGTGEPLTPVVWVLESVRTPCLACFGFGSMFFLDTCQLLESLQHLLSTTWQEKMLHLRCNRGDFCVLR